MRATGCVLVSIAAHLGIAYWLGLLPSVAWRAPSRLDALGVELVTAPAAPDDGSTLLAVANSAPHPTLARARAGDPRTREGRSITDARARGRARAAAPAPLAPLASVDVAAEAPPGESSPATPQATDAEAAGLATDGAGEGLVALAVGGLGSGAAGGGDGDGEGSGGGDAPAAGREAPPSAPRCGDPINGVWVAVVHFGSRGHTSRPRLEIERDGEQLRGTIVNQIWPDGRPHRSCAEGGMEHVVRMEARGELHGDRFTFGGTSVADDPRSCWGWFSYALDRFRGTLVPEEDRLYAIWDDQGSLVGQHVHFRRLGCVGDVPP